MPAPLLLKPIPVLDFEPPENWPRPALIEVVKGRLIVVASGESAPAPHPGCWRSLSECGSTEEFTAVAKRYGGLTTEATAAGEPVQAWRELVTSLQLLAAAWTADGKLAEPPFVLRARAAALGLHVTDLGQHLISRGAWLPRALTVAMGCETMLSFWRRQAVADVGDLAAFSRCRFCGAWLSSRLNRADRSFCIEAHRSAFHQGRKPKSSFWAEA